MFEDTKEKNIIKKWDKKWNEKHYRLRMEQVEKVKEADKEKYQHNW